MLQIVTTVISAGAGGGGGGGGGGGSSSSSSSSRSRNSSSSSSKVIIQTEESRCITTLSLTSVLNAGGWSAPRSGRFTPGKTRYPLYKRLDGPQGRSGRVRKI